MNEKIMVVDDHDDIREVIHVLLTNEGYQIIEAKNGKEALELLDDSIDLIILDVMMPEMNGYQVCLLMREKTNAPILFLTAKGQESDKTLGFSSGGDDYLTKPCNMERLLARIKSLLRRTEQQQIQHDLLKGNGFLLDPHTFTIYVGKTSYVLPPNEGKILLTLLMNYPRTVSKEELFHALWGTDKFIDENALQVNFTRLRKTMRNYGLDDRIETVRGEGYRLKVQVDI